MATEPTPHTLKILQTPAPPSEIGIGPMTRTEAHIRMSVPTRIPRDHPARVLRAAGNTAVVAIENALAAANGGLTDADVKQISALSHALDVSVGVIAARILEASCVDEEDRRVETAVLHSLDRVWKVMGDELGERVGNPMAWHPDASALAAILTDVAQGWRNTPSAMVTGRLADLGGRLADAVREDADAGAPS